MKRLNVFKSLAVLFVLSSIRWGLAPGEALGAVPQLINFQGVLRDGPGNPVPDGSYSVVFTIYDAPSAGNVIWTETQSVTTTDGLFTILLGNSTPVLDSIFNDSSRWLGIQVGADPEMTPRQRLSSVGFSHRSSEWTSDGQNLFRSSGNVGIGTTSPAERLDVDGSIAIRNSNSLKIFSDGVGLNFTNAPGAFGTLDMQKTGDLNPSVRLGHSNFPARAFTIMTGDGTGGATERITVLPSGNVGIGTTTPTAKLEVLNSVSSASAEQGVSGIVSNSSTGSAFGGVFTASSAGTGIKTGARGNASSGSANPAYGVFGEADNSSTGDAYGGFFSVPSSGGTGISYGVYSSIGSPNGFGFYTPNDAYLGGNVGIGTTSPTEKLDVDGSIAIRNSNSLKIFSDGVGLNFTNAPGAFGTLDMQKTGDLNPSVRLGHSNFPARAFTIMTGNGTGGAVERLTVLPTGEVGIGTTNPVGRLDVAGGNVNLENSTASAGNILKGGVRFIHNFGTNNTFIGLNAGNLTMTGTSNTASGNNAFDANTTGSGNTASGFNALGNNTTGELNTASGNNALGSNTTGGSNTAIGVAALSSNTTGFNNTAIGFAAGVSAGNLTNATAIGSGASVNASNKIRLGDAAVTVLECQVALTVVSDKNQKENFRPVDGNEVLKKIRGLELSSWNYKGHDPKQFRHYGPMAQDFFAAFGDDGVGKVGTETTLNSGDMAGILMIAVKALEERTAEVAELKARIEALEKLQAVRR